jgi:hypothetical protein
VCWGRAVPREAPAPRPGPLAWQAHHSTSGEACLMTSEFFISSVASRQAAVLPSTLSRYLVGGWWVGVVGGGSKRHACVCACLCAWWWWAGRRASARPS